jgi:hypothetical protein
MIANRRQRAFHEAGHLTVAYMLMRRSAEIGRALIFENADGEPAGATLIAPRQKIADRILNTYHLGGVFAEALALNDGKPIAAWPDESSDLWRRAPDDIEGLDGEEMEYAGRFAEEFLRQCWPFVCAVVKKIERDGIIVLRELHAIYHRYYPEK